MLFDQSQATQMQPVPQPAIGSQPHWSIFAAVAADPSVFNPLHAQIVRIVATEIATNPTRPTIESRRAGKEALEAIGSAWHAIFPRRFPHLPNGAERGVFGMMLWNYLAGHSDNWCFSGVSDPHGYGQDSIIYWRI